MKQLFCVAALLISGFAMNASTTVANPGEITVSTRTTFNVSPFCAAIVKGDFDTVKKLIELGADVNETSKGLTPLMYAAKFNRCDIMKLLISEGAKLNAKDSRLGYTAMDFAKVSNATEAIKVLEDAKNS